jgi:hypothetical protein
MKIFVAGHYRADITARDTTAPTIPRGDITASDFTAHDVTACYLYRARHYSDYCFLTLKNNFLKQFLKLFEFLLFWMNI